MSCRRRLPERQWGAIQNFWPEPERRTRRGRPAVDNRAGVEGILGVLRSGARWRALPPPYPSPATCWRRLRRWEETFLEATFFPAQKGGDAGGKTKRGKGTNAVVLADGQGMPWGVFLASATRPVR